MNQAFKESLSRKLRVLVIPSIHYGASTCCVNGNSTIHCFTQLKRRMPEASSLSIFKKFEGKRLNECLTFMPDAKSVFHSIYISKADFFCFLAGGLAIIFQHVMMC